MKTTLKISFAALLLFVGVSAFAQQQLKLGYINSAEVLSLMPERDSAQKNLEAYGKDLQDQFTGMQTEYSTKVQDYSKKAATYSDVIRQQVEKELTTLRSNIEEFTQIAQEDIAKKEQELMQPIIVKVRDAINSVGKDNSFTYIFDLSTGSLVFVNESSATNVLPLVKAKLGLK